MSAPNGRAADSLRGATMLPPVAPAPGTKPKRTRATHGRFVEINGFIDYTLAGLTPSAVAVWLILWRDTKPNGLARTGQADLARRAGVTERAVRKALAELDMAKLVKVVRRGRAGTGPSTYRVRGVNPDRTEVTGTGVPAV
ncbi:Similar to transcriptional regulator OS=Rhodopirellula baltica (strain SH1) GN=RB12209 PE=4 SV=1 [Gemmata massiliana]|uniref:Similar to transcriptional regulator n=1 Tax=Gemmata massiliana TaxID=1210884 RepID=A0A6P2D001_9BACT|nr:helix-turn-helix domain-containing protein [Gemmata massiliana]VTR92752.1 Similar to transcriptional regulator OS=Rhodopirellula baltica (strain SH1) GN=RB12209 PE=4 SV=1 [Gemmata massiliana]